MYLRVSTSHLNSSLPVDAKCLHDAKNLLIVVTQVGVVVLHGEGQRLLLLKRWVSLHPLVLLYLGNGYSLGWVHNQHPSD